LGLKPGIIFSDRFHGIGRSSAGGKSPLRVVFFLLCVLVWGCVPNSKFVYMQKDDVRKKNIPTDTVLRNYGMKLDDYRIQPMDLLSIRVETNTAEEYDFTLKLNPGGQNSSQNSTLNGFLIDNNGEVEYPVIGKIKLAGLSVFEAQDRLRDAVGIYLSNPVVRVRLLNFRFTLLGEVTAEKQVISQNTRITMMEAIGMGGGLSDLADRSKVKVVRQVGGKSEVFYVNLLKEEFVTSRYYYVQQNDIIIVPALRQRPFRQYFQQNTLLFVTSITALLILISLTKSK